MKPCRLRTAQTRPYCSRHPVIAGNVQAVKLRYMLAVIDAPVNFDLQLELLQSLHGAGPAFTPQMELELAVLMFQGDRSHEGERLISPAPICLAAGRPLWRGSASTALAPEFRTNGSTASARSSCIELRGEGVRPRRRIPGRGGAIPACGIWHGEACARYSDGRLCIVWP